MSTDRLQEIKERAADPKIPWQKADVLWLIDEVEQLRAERYVDSEAVALRAMVSELQDFDAKSCNSAKGARVPCPG